MEMKTDSFYNAIQRKDKKKIKAFEKAMKRGEVVRIM